MQASGIGIGRGETKVVGEAKAVGETKTAAETSDTRAARETRTAGAGAGVRPGEKERSLGRGGDGASKFKQVLHRKGASEVDGSASCAAEVMAAAIPATALPRELETRPFAVNRAAPVNPVSRVLVGEGPRGPQARVEFRAGPLAGTALQLGVGRDGVNVQLVAAAEGARLALARVVDRVEARLRTRGIVMKAGAEKGRTGGERDGREPGRR